MAARVLEGSKLKYPIDEKTLGHFFFNRFTQFSNRICQIDGTSDLTETYGSLKLRTIRMAMEFQKRHITSDDVILTCSLNTLNNVVPIIAATYIGAKVSNLDPSLSARHVNHLLRLVTPKIIFVQESSLKLIEDGLQGTTFETTVVVFESSEKYEGFEDFVNPHDHEDKFVPSDVDEEEAALFFFSSGSTGLPKTICHSYRSYFVAISQACQIGWGDKILQFNSFYWTTAVMMLCACTNLGTSRVFCRNASVEDIFRIIEKYRVRSIFVAPILAYELANFDNRQKYDTSSLKIVITGGTAIATSQMKNLCNLFPSALTTILYGITETSIVTDPVSNFDPEVAQKKITSCGKVAPDIKFKVINPDTEEMLGPNQRGEICVSGPSLMLGYYKMDSSHCYTKDGFFKTGDIGYYDEDDFVYIVQRMKEIFKYQSWPITPFIIEMVLLEHPLIKEAVVFGIPHKIKGEIPAACIVLKPGATLTEVEIDTFLTGQVADRERLRGGVIFVKSLPLTPTGKVIRSQVRDFAISLKK